MGGTLLDSKVLDLKKSGKAETRKGNRKVNLSAFQDWLAGLDLGYNPTIHINGPQYPQAVLVVDFGQPLQPVKLTNEQTHELLDHMRTAAGEVVGKEPAAIHVNYDQSNGVYWAYV